MEWIHLDQDRKVMWSCEHNNEPLVSVKKIPLPDEKIVAFGKGPHFMVR